MQLSRICACARINNTEGRIWFHFIRFIYIFSFAQVQFLLQTFIGFVSEFYVYRPAAGA